ncbi:hypothetical protein VTG60DRAFT_4041 [Thermothelomyces hinnuleus]
MLVIKQDVTLSPPKPKSEQKDRAQREALNQQYAGSAYHIPHPEDITFDDCDLSGLPWGDINMQHVVARGHASASSGHQTHSHYSGYSGENRRDSELSTGSHPTAASAVATGSMGTPLTQPVDLVDQALYSMNPYRYAVAAVPDAASSVGGGTSRPTTIRRHTGTTTLTRLARVVVSITGRI